MSVSLLKKSLEIVEASSYFANAPPSHGKKAGARKHNPFTAPSTSVQQDEYKGTKKTAQFKAKPKATAGSRPTILSKRAGKSAIQVAQEKLQQNQSRTEENLQKLLAFSAVQLDAETTQKLIRRAQNKRYIIPEAKPKEESSTVFTDEDFEKFEKEYFCS